MSISSDKKSINLKLATFNDIFDEMSATVLIEI